MSQTTEQLDCRNLLCPLPVIRTQEKIEGMASGASLTVTCTDPGVLQDIPTWCRIHGHEVTEIVEEEREIRITIAVL